MFTVDLHAHTRFFHAFRARPTAYDPIGARMLARCSRREKLDGVALTNHDYYAEFDVNPDDPRFIPGVEVTTTAGHVLVIGPDPPVRTPPGELTPREVVSLAHANGCVAVIAHPFRESRVRESGADFDAVEINGKHPGNIEQVRELSDRLDLPIVGGSDAHFPFEVGRAFTRLDAEQLTPESVVSAIREGRVEPGVRQNQFDVLMRTGYRFVHRHVG